MSAQDSVTPETHNLRKIADQTETTTAFHQALAAAYQNAQRLAQPSASGLYLTATPIGNAGDISLRALTAFASADVVLCEDTRVTAKLMSLYGLSPKLVAYHDHNAAEVRPRILKQLQEGAVVVQVTDAGTPLINDPGYKLVTAAVDSDVAVTTLPGASAPIAALTVAGLPTDRFLYVGFPPNKIAARQTFLTELSTVACTLVFLESVHRLPASLSDMAQVLGARDAAVCRELTKKFEEVRRGTLPDLAAQYATEGAPKGEVVVIVGPPAAGETPWTEDRIDQALRQALEDGLRMKEAAQAVADITGLKKRDLYNRALILQNED